QQTQPTLLVLWGQHDPSFDISELVRYRQDVPHAAVSVIDAGHFALDTQAEPIAPRLRDLMQTQPETPTRLVASGHRTSAQRAALSGGGVMDRRSLLTALSLGAAPLCALPALAETVGSDRKNWLPDGLGYRARLGLLTPNDDAVPVPAWWTMAP